MDKVTNLSMHKNNLQQKAQKDLRRELIEEAKTLSTMDGIAGYTLVAWTYDGEDNVSYYVDGFPELMLPEFVKMILLREIITE